MPEHKLALTLSYHAEPGDSSGIMRDTDAEGTPCGTSGFTERSDTFSFMKPGTDALLLDGAGTILAKSTLDAPGTAHNIGRAGKNEFDCLWELTFTKVPEVDFYQVDIGGITVATMTADDLEESGWDLAVEMQPQAR